MKPIIVGITGGSASGKSYVTDIMKKIIPDSTLLSQDNFYKGIPDGVNPELYNFDDVNAIDYDLLIECVKKLKDGDQCNIPTYDFQSHSRKKEKILVEPSRIIIVEGILILCNESLRNLFDVKVFIDADPETRFSRRIQRDIKERKREIDSIIYQYRKFVKPAYDNFIEPCKKYVDLVIPNNYDIEFDKQFIGINFLCNSLVMKK